MDHQLRAATILDLDAVLEWIGSAEGLRVWGGPALVHPPEARAVWAAIQAEDRTTFVLVDRMGQVAGFGQILPRAEATAHLARIIVSPECRGLGLGRMLCRRLMAFAEKEFSSRTFTLKVYPGNTPAITLYRSLGFAACPSGNDEEVLLMKREMDGRPDPRPEA
jgi:ribosomal protein S18 acetylase RimI-like enzyme